MMIKSFWLVKSPISAESTIEDCCWESNPHEYAAYVLGQGEVDIIFAQHIVLFDNQQEAREHAQSRIDLYARLVKILSGSAQPTV